MTDLYERVTGEQDIFKKLVSYIPGFKGYVERDNRRTADKLLRDQVALRFKELHHRVSNMQKDIAEADEIEQLDDVESIALKLRTFADKIENASYGYAGFFDAVKIREDELSQLYAFDIAFFEMGDNISNGLDNLEAAIGGEGLKAAIRHVNTLAREIIEIYERRYQVITGSQQQ